MSNGAYDNTELVHPVPPKYLETIGDITVSFALLENHMQSIVGLFIGTNYRIDQIITAELSFKGIRTLIISLCKEHGSQNCYLNLLELIKKTAPIEEKRNQIIHSLWAVSSQENHITRIKKTAKEKKGLDFSFSEVSIDELTSFAREIRQLAAKLQFFYIDEIIRRHQT